MMITLLNAVRKILSLSGRLRVVYNDYCNELMRPVNVARESIVL